MGGVLLVGDCSCELGREMLNWIISVCAVLILLKVEAQFFYVITIHQLLCGV